MSGFYLFVYVLWIFLIGNLAPEEASNQLCFNPCTPKLGNNECNTICVNKKYKEGSCVGFGIPPTFKYCCCKN